MVGLGNPGPKYAKTRHNVGFRVVDHLAGARPWATRELYDHASTTIRSHTVRLVRPTTFMNDSGLAVSDAMDRFGSKPDDVLVLVDDIHLDVGRIRVRRGGSKGGHNGLRSIVAALESDAFPRVRMGVGEVPGDQTQIEYVLGEFDTNEVVLVELMVLRAADAVRTWCYAGVESAMNSFNGR